MNRSTPYRLFSPNHHRAQFAVISLGVAALGSVMAAVTLLDAYSLLQRISSAPLLRAESVFISQQLETMAAFQLLVYVITGLLYLMWIYHAYQNHAALYPQSADYSPDWSVWGFLIPIVNLFRPYQVVDEMWRAAGNSINSLQPNRPRRSLRSIVLAWWITFLAPQFLNRLAGGWTVRVYNSSAYTPLLISLLSELLLIISAVLTIHIIQTIDLNHEVAARRISPQSGWPALPHWRPWLYVITLIITVAAASFVWKERPAPEPLEIAAGTPTPLPTLRPSVYGTPLPTRSGTAAPTRSLTVTPTPRPPLNPEARDGLQYFKDGEYELALVQFARALRHDPRDARIYYYRGLAYNALNNRVKAMKDFDQALKLDGKYVAAYIDRGWLHVYDNNYGKAQADFDKAIGLDKDVAGAYAGRGYTHYLLEEHKQALADADHAINLDGDLPDGHYVRGLVQHAVGEYERAVEDFSAALNLDEDWAEVLYWRGVSYVELEDDEAARADFDQAIELEPDYLAPYFDRGILSYHTGQYAEALDDLNRVLKELPEEGAAYFWRGAVYYKVNNPAKAIADLERTLDYSIEADIRRAAEDLLKELKGETRPTS